jgi:hypothetical protein
VGFELTLLADRSGFICFRVSGSKATQAFAKEAGAHRCNDIFNDHRCNDIFNDHRRVQKSIIIERAHNNIITRLPMLLCALNKRNESFVCSTCCSV